MHSKPLFTLKIGRKLTICKCCKFVKKQNKNNNLFFSVEQLRAQNNLQYVTSSTFLVNGDAYILPYRLHTYLGLNINGSPY